MVHPHIPGPDQVVAAILFNINSSIHNLCLQCLQYRQGKQCDMHMRSCVHMCVRAWVFTWHQNP